MRLLVHRWLLGSSRPHRREESRPRRWPVSVRYPWTWTPWTVPTPSKRSPLPTSRMRPGWLAAPSNAYATAARLRRRTPAPRCFARLQITRQGNSTAEGCAQHGIGSPDVSSTYNLRPMTDSHPSGVVFRGHRSGTGHRDSRAASGGTPRKVQPAWAARWSGRAGLMLRCQESLLHHRPNIATRVAGSAITAA